MTKPGLEIPNVSGKTVDSVMLYYDPSSDREVTIRFTDQSELPVIVECRQIAEVRNFDVNSN